MKKLILVAILTVANVAFANNVDSVFRKESVLPDVLKEKTLEAIKLKCAKIVSDYGLQEITTSLKTETIDQGMVDVYYTTTFSSRYNFDGTHPVTTYITVESAEYAFSNGNNLEVLKVQSQSNDCEE